MDSYDIVLFGAGNVATHLSRHLRFRGHRIRCICSRAGLRLDALAGELGVPAVTRADRVPRGADFYILAVPDGVVGEVLDAAADPGGIWLHTAGAVDASVFHGKRQHFGVLYPLQSIRSEHPVDWDNLPLLAEGSDEAVEQKILKLAGSLSSVVLRTDSDQRLKIHLAAVFANNFGNHLVRIALELMKKENLDPGLLEPLIRETCRRAVEAGPEKSQTGPAVRGDLETQVRHLELLKNLPEWQKIYTFMSRDIQRLAGDAGRKDSENEQA
ncbi:MAG: Rossmann-like and DUF2520 domain-containing protein [Bacteroidales bacterium]